MNQSANNKRKDLFRKFLSTEDGHFAIDTTKNVFWFCVIALSSLGLESLVKWEQAKGASNAIVYVLTGAEYAVLGADIIWFLSRLALSTYIGVTKVINEIKKYRKRLTNSASASSTPLDSSR